MSVIVRYRQLLPTAIFVTCVIATRGGLVQYS